MDLERLARIETKQEHILEKLDQIGASVHGFQDTREKVLIMEASAKAVWWVLGVMGTVTVSVSGFVAWLVATYKQHGG